MSVKTPLEQLQYEYNTLKVIAVIQLCALLFFAFLLANVIEQKQLWREEAKSIHSRLLNSMRHPLCPPTMTSEVRP